MEEALRVVLKSRRNLRLRGLDVSIGRSTGVIQVVTDIAKRSPALPQVSFLRPMATEGFALLSFAEKRGRHVDDQDDHLTEYGRIDHF